MLASVDMEVQRVIVERKVAAGPLGFPEFLEHEDYCGPYHAARDVTISPVVYAIAEASEGRRPTRIDEDTCQRIFKCALDDLATGRYAKTVVVGAGRGGGKTSTLDACKVAHAIWTTDLPHVAPGQMAVAIAMSPYLFQAEECFNYVRGVFESSPLMSTAIDWSRTNSERLVIVRPDGKTLMFRTGAADKGGGAFRSKTLVIAVLDEACFFADEGGAKNDKAQFDAAQGSMGSRRIEKAQTWITSTPWVEGEGLMEELIAEHWGDPGNDKGVLVAARVSTYDLKGEVDDGHYMSFCRNDEVYKREYLAVPFARGTIGFFDITKIEEAFRLLRPEGAECAKAAGGDFAFESDMNALAIASRYIGGAFYVEHMREDPSKLDGDTLAKTYTADIKAHGLSALTVDGHCYGLLVHHFKAHGARLIKCSGALEFKPESWTAMRDLLNEGRLCLGGLPASMRDRVKFQLRQVHARMLAGGKIEIGIKRHTAKQVATAASRGEDVSGHGDAIAALVLALAEAGSMNRACWNSAPRARSAGKSSKRRGGYRGDGWRGYSSREIGRV